MSDYTVLGAVDETLIELLWSEMQSDSAITAILATRQQLSPEPPFKLVKEGDPDQNMLSLYLYRLSEDDELKNRPLERRDPNLLHYPPLALRLFYLITPLTNSTANDHRVLGKTLQILYDHPILSGFLLQGTLAGSNVELRVILNPLPLEDLSKLWTAYMRPYRLSVGYEIKVVYIDSERETEAERVRRKRIEYQPGV